MTQQLPLEEVITRLQQQDEIDGILLAGTTGKETLKPYSDYDLIIVLNDMPITPSLIITTIEGYLAELYFLKASTLDEMLANPTTVEANSLLGAFTSMTVRGEIVYDASGKLTQLRTIADDTHYADILDHQVYSSWYSVTYNHAQNLRYYHSQDPLYLDALQCRLLYCVSNALSAYFTLRRLPWRGEKEAIRYLRENDPSYWDVFQACVNASGIHQQFERYTTLIEATLPDSMSIWGDDYTVIQPHAHLTEESINQHQVIWKQWMNEKPSKN
ncbi:MAG: hypothetical protein AAFV93_10280 [Chloroflexota bacterium]